MDAFIVFMLIGTSCTVILHIVNGLQWRKWYKEGHALNKEYQRGIEYRQGVLDGKVLNREKLTPAEQEKLPDEIRSWLSSMERIQERQDIWWRSMPSKLWL